MKRWWGFLPYAVIGAVHLGALGSAASGLVSATKVLLMPALLLALLAAAAPRWRSRLVLVASLAVLLSWGGDVFLSAPGDGGFVVGLAFFLLAHAAYLLVFLGPAREHRMPLVALLYLPWWGALVLILAPHLGALLFPVSFYGLVLGASAAAALGSNRLAGVGALLFLLSDSLLALKLFFPHFQLWQQDAIIMLAYIVGQGLIIMGVVTRARSVDVSSKPVASS